ncbi:unnamed protein product [Alternaria alternata]
MASTPHPLDPLTPEEITKVANAAQSSFEGQALNFRVITLREPPKDELVTYLEAEHRRDQALPKIRRCARVEILVRSKNGANDLFELIVAIDSNNVIGKQHLEGKHSYIDAAYMKEVEEACLRDPKVQAEIETLNIPEGASVIVEPWAYATDDANYYAYPLDVCAEVSEDLEVTKIYRLPTSGNEQIHHEIRSFNRGKIHATDASEYHPDLRSSPRTTTKPYQVVQPEGPSFQINGHRVNWEKWTFRVGFNYREGHAVVTRSRILVLQTIITVSNYEYIFAFHFGQDASINYEVRATGILSTAPIALGEPKPPFGTIVAPGVLAPYHQHLFCLRIDPAIDGHKNTVVIEESHAMPVNDPDVHNPFGVGYETRTNYIEHEGGFDLDLTKNRVFKIVNEAETNAMTQTPVGFKLLPSYSRMLLAHPSSFHARRSEYSKHAVWVTKYREDEMFPSGKYTMQSMGGDGIASAIEKRAGDKKQASVRNEDVVVWHTFGSTHNPRIEDWPVMPCEKMVIGLKPVNFFDKNPGLDVAPSTQEVNKSVLYDGDAANAQDCCTKSAI